MPDLGNTVSRRRSGSAAEKSPLPPPPQPPQPPTLVATGTRIDPEVDAQRHKDVWIVLLGVRIFNAVSVATFFQPDEYYQALEPAWQIAFGSSQPRTGAWITWEWQHQLRSSMFPYLIAFVYESASAVAKLLGFPAPVEAQLLNLLPPILMAFFAATTEYSTWRLSEKAFGKASVESWAVLTLLLFSPWQWFVSTRTLSNGVEASLTAAALSLWPWALFDARATPEERGSSLTSVKYSLILAGVASVLRPTNVLIWAVLAMYTMAKSTQDELILLVREAGIYGPIVLCLTSAVDRVYYSSWVFPPVKWLHYNLTQNLAVFYGANRHDYYLTEGLPLLLTTALPFAVWGIYKALTTFVWTPPGQITIPVSANPAILRPLAVVSITSIAALSFISHKEVRFIYPLLPALTLLAARPLISFFAPFPNPQSVWKKLLMFVLLSINIGLAVYIMLFHQRGVVDVTHFLRKQFETSNYEQFVVGSGSEHESLTHLSVGFLMPCHSTPWRSHLAHSEIEAWALTCEPPINVDFADRADYMDEADMFYANPPHWLREHMLMSKPLEPWNKDNLSSTRDATTMNNRRSWPQYLVFFEQLIKDATHGHVITEMLAEKGYEECWRGWNSHWHDDWRRQGDILAYCIRAADSVAKVRESMWQANSGKWVLR